MAGLIVSSVLDFVKQKVTAFLDDQYKLRSDVKGKLNTLLTVVNRIKAVANTADEVDLEKHKELKAWMRELKDAAEEASDVVDEFDYLDLERQAKGEGADDELVGGKRRKTLFGFIPNLSKSATILVISNGLLERLSSTLSKLEELARSSELFLKLVDDRKTTERKDGLERETASSVDEPKWIGRQGVLDEIINKLLEEEKPVSDEGSIPLIAVVGHGGMGKTTLTQHIFNHSKVKSHFDTRMWAYVSQVFDVPTITRRIIESAAPNVTCSNTESLETLQLKLKDTLNKSKRFLLVLDDVWYGQNKFTMEEQWNKLCSPLAEVGGKGGSKILLTSRTPEVKDLPSPLINMIPLKGLTQDECWSIIERSAFRGHKNLHSYEHLVPVGKKIALKVHGSPLAAKALGGILRKDLNLTHWENILNIELSKIGEDNVMPVLKLSYRHLPPHLRQCFAYCSLFPKGHKFQVDMLIRMWVAHGYICW